MEGSVSLLFFSHNPRLSEKHIISEIGDTFFSTLPGPPSIFATHSFTAPTLAVFLTSRSNQKKWRGPSHFFFSPTTLGFPKTILSPKSETLFFPPCRDPPLFLLLFRSRGQLWLFFSSPTRPSSDLGVRLTSFFLPQP